MGKAWHSAFREKRELASFHKPNTCGEEEKWGRIANPVVHQTLNELRKLINEVLAIMGKKPQEIAVEVGRALKMGKEDRDRLSFDQSKREKDAQRIYDTYCKPNNLPKKNIQDFRLWEQQGKQCPYCLKTISVSDIINHNVDIDHILPNADTADGSENNKVLAHKLCNEKKAKRTPYAAFSGTSEWKSICQYIGETEGMKGKLEKFEMTDEQYEKYLSSKGFLSRFASDNSYVAKVAMEYLACLYEKPTSIRTLKGGETALLRRSWDIQKIDDELGQLHVTAKDDESVRGKNRDDNRHHSLDAIVAAYCSRSYVKKINTLSAQGKCAAEIVNTLPIPKYFVDEKIDRKGQEDLFYRYLKSFLELNGFVSFKVDNDRNGQLLKDTKYSILASQGENLILLVNKQMKQIPVKDGSFEEVKKAMEGKGNFEDLKFPDDVKKMISKLQEENEKCFERYQKLLPKAKEDLEKQNDDLKANGKKQLVVTPVTISKKALELCGGMYHLISNNSRKKVFVTKEPTETIRGSAIDTGENLCIDLYHDNNGKLQGEVIRKIHGVDKSYIPEYKKHGYQLFERLYQGDILEIDTRDSITANPLKTNVTIGNAVHGRTLVHIITFTEVGKNNIQIYFSCLAKANGGQDDSFMITTMGRRHPRKMTLSSAGLVSFVSPVLQNVEQPSVESD